MCAGALLFFLPVLHNRVSERCIVSDFIEELRARIAAEDERHNARLRDVLAPPAPKHRRSAPNPDQQPSDTADDADAVARAEALLKALKKPRKPAAKGSATRKSTPKKKAPKAD